MAAIQVEIVVSFHSFTMANYITTVPQMALSSDGAQQHSILEETVNGGFATTRARDEARDKYLSISCDIA